MPTSDTLRTYAAAVPVNAILAAGFGPTRFRVKPGPLVDTLTALRSSALGRQLAAQSMGLTGHRVQLVLASLRGSVTAERFAYETQPANPAELAATLERLHTADVLTTEAGGTLRLAAAVVELRAGASTSYADSTLTNDDLARFCRNLSIVAPARKQDRIAALGAAFATPARRAAVRDSLSTDALELLTRLAEHAVLDRVPSGDLAINVWEVDRRRHFSSRYALSDRITSAFTDLADHGIVGYDTYNDVVWIWGDAWPLLERRLIEDWSVPPRPPIVAHGGESEPAVPSCVGQLDHLLLRWRDQPAAVLKNAEARLPKQEVRNAARSLHAPEPTIELLAALAISLRLVRATEVGRSGRGRNQRITEVWALSADETSAWRELSPRHRWGRLVAEWCNQHHIDETALLTRHLLLWELQQLAADQAYADDDEFLAWFIGHHATVADPGALGDALVELRALGVMSTGAVALTRLGRALLADPDAVVHAALGEAGRAFVQADLTVIAPPDLNHEHVLALERIAVVEGTGGATIYRLDAARLTRAVQGDDTAESILALLTELSGTELPDSVTRLVADAAAQAGAVQVASATTVIVVEDPAQLTKACAIKALALTRLAPTVAITDVALTKVQTALEAKGIIPKIVVPNAPPKTAAQRKYDDTYAAFVADLLAARDGLPRPTRGTGKSARELLDDALAVPPALTLTAATLEDLVDPNRHG